jgi:hypothetical protein
MKKDYQNTYEKENDIDTRENELINLKKAQ